MNKVRVYYIGKQNKDPKKDTVAGTKHIWRGGIGSHRIVDEDAAQTLCDYPDIWVDEETYLQKYTQKGETADAENKPGLSDLPVVDQQNVSGSTSGMPANPEQSTSRKVLIQEAIRQLDRTSKAHFTGQGAPKIVAVREVMQGDVEQKELNEAFNEIKEEFRA